MPTVAAATVFLNSARDILPIAIVALPGLFLALAAMVNPHLVMPPRRLLEVVPKTVENRDVAAAPWPA
jgi:hypothetical protein